MNRVTLLLGISVLIIFLSVSVAMSDDSGPYISVIGGYTLPNESENEDYTGSYFISHEPGISASGSLGYRLGDSFPQIGKGRMEIEFSYRKNDLEDVEFSTGKFSAEGNISSLSVLINTIAEYTDHPYTTPYVGVGIGVAQLSFNNATVEGDAIADDDATVLAYQFMVGTTLPLYNNLLIDIGYRLMGTSEPEFTDSRQRLLTSSYMAHSAGLGLRIDF